MSSILTCKWGQFPERPRGALLNPLSPIHSSTALQRLGPSVRANRSGAPLIRHAAVERNVLNVFARLTIPVVPTVARQHVILAVPNVARQPVSRVSRPAIPVKHGVISRRASRPAIRARPSAARRLARPAGHSAVRQPVTLAVPNAIRRPAIRVYTARRTIRMCLRAGPDASSRKCFSAALLGFRLKS